MLKNISLDDYIHPSFHKTILCYILNSELLYKYKTCKIVKAVHTQSLRKASLVCAVKVFDPVRHRPNGLCPLRLSFCSCILKANIPHRLPCSNTPSPVCSTVSRGCGTCRGWGPHWKKWIAGVRPEVLQLRLRFMSNICSLFYHLNVGFEVTAVFSHHGEATCHHASSTIVFLRVSVAVTKHYDQK